MSFTILYYSVVLNSAHGGSNHAKQFLKFAGKHADIDQILTFPQLASRKPSQVSQKWGWLKQHNWFLLIRFYRRNSHYLKELIELIKKENPRVLIMRPDNNFLQIGRLRKQFPDLLLVSEINTSAFAESYLQIPFRSYFKNLERDTYAQADLNFFVSDSLRDDIFGDKTQGKRDFVVYNGVDPMKFKRNQPDAEYKKKINLEGKIVIGYLGTLDFHKHVDVLIQAFSHLRKEYADLVLLIVGDGPEREKLDQLIDELKLSKAVHITGWKNGVEVPDYVFSFDIAVHHFANAYGCPQKLLEYMAAGIPSIGPDIPFVTDNFENGKHLLITKFGDIQVANSIKRLLDNPELADSLAQSGKDYVSKNFTWEKSANEIISQIVLNLNEKN
ncbi:glycosyltransferase family 4 protein [Algoriphagus chordae]|uniref:Glycosyltransferase involved in cell wall biosynthesis n=1 Tax=Algoriphagus chordae TaxID=237019 RepID=A0A2W7RAL9_9BACT|nr:glycosyltransferase family 4 protein [Algoriphagus chordae]PZX47635.1 glycosyltransferase involved in cell wall biosynthesis [Algoriphagus chordae]